LVLAPHPDDEVIGCAGLIFAHSQIGGETTVIYLTCSDETRRREARSARVCLNIKHSMEVGLQEGRVRPTNRAKDIIAKTLKQNKPYAILVPCLADPHVDHRGTHIILAAVLAASADVESEIMVCEGFTPIADANVWFDITPVAERKWKALECFKSQERYRLGEVVRHLNAYRGLTMMRPDIRFAEAFRRMSAQEYIHRVTSDFRIVYRAGLRYSVDARGSPRQGES